MQAHQVANEYHLQKWINHPNVSSILALSALEHEGDAIAALEAGIKELFSKLKSNEDRTGRLANRVEKIEKMK